VRLERRGLPSLIELDEVLMSLTVTQARMGQLEAGLANLSPIATEGASARREESKNGARRPLDRTLEVDMRWPLDFEEPKKFNATTTAPRSERAGRRVEVIATR